MLLRPPQAQIRSQELKKIAAGNAGRDQAAHGRSGVRVRGRATAPLTRRRRRRRPGARFGQSAPGGAAAARMLSLSTNFRHFWPSARPEGLRSSLRTQPRPSTGRPRARDSRPRPVMGRPQIRPQGITRGRRAPRGASTPRTPLQPPRATRGLPLSPGGRPAPVSQPAQTMGAGRQSLGIAG